MKHNLPDAELRRLKDIQNKLTVDINEYLQDGYQAVALHSSSIIVEVNHACAELFGYIRDEMIYMNAWKLFPPESVTELMHRLTSKSTEAYSVKAIKKDGSLFTIELKGYDFEIAGEPIRSVSLKEIM